MSDECLIIRTDASTQIGTGHVMRCLALAQAWQDIGGQGIFVKVMESQSLDARLKSEGMEVVHLSAQLGSTDDATQTADLAHQRNASWVVIDGYHFGAGYQQIIKDSGLRFLFVDDMGHADHYFADIVLNQNIHAHEGLYTNREPYTRLLLGTRYVQLHREFLKWQGWKREIPDVAHRVLVTLGGSDPHNMTLRVIQILNHIDIPNLDVKIVVGPSNPNIKSLQNAMLSAQCSMRILQSVKSMPELMAWADMAIISAGGTLWELLYMSGSIISYVRNHVQDMVVSELDRLAIVKHQGYINQINPGTLAASLQEIALSELRRKYMSKSGRLIVDGAGTARTFKVLADNNLF